MTRTGLRALLRSQPGMIVVGEAADGRTAVSLAADLSPDVVVMDINMPDLDGVEATRRIAAAGNGTKVVALSGHSDDRSVREMLKAGAAGYVLKDAAFEELAAAVRAVVEGKVYVSPRVAGIVVDDLMHGGASGDSSSAGRRTTREREVLQLLAEGKATKQAAMHLHVSVKTVETHRRNIMEKLGLDSVAELTKYALREGLTSLHA